MVTHQEVYNLIVLLILVEDGTQFEEVDGS